jgi:hypothetical protein
MRGQRRMPDRPAQVWRAALAHPRLARRLSGLMALGVVAHQCHQWIGIGEAPEVPDLGRDGRCGCRLYARHRAQIPVRARIALATLLIQGCHQAFQIMALPPQELPCKGQGCRCPADPDFLLCRCLQHPTCLGPQMALREAREHRGRSDGGHGHQLVWQRLRCQEHAGAQATDVVAAGGKLRKGAIYDAVDASLEVPDLGHQVRG